ncbi:hypothetical protein [Nocardia huaxiensis]|uniref:Uncharacterized protein n=1 Tax=Nocardia huaxiensis TaxID=2755382 RepID=A0A7D6ZDU0_9NOCA|nr:hypothetical protein [Nocardia huaxiensis]QLY28539.1 hypothetical protein H0264_24670 [Nocardia huaxiensis]UFS97998.1 hypothetical protein LPY97_08935 [Nocardia huaxiensis]
MSDAARQLASTLQAPLPDAFHRLPDPDLTELDRLLKTAQRQRGDNLDAAIETSLDFVPRLMRPAVKKALGL